MNQRGWDLKEAKRLMGMKHPIRECAKVVSGSTGRRTRGELNPLQKKGPRQEGKSSNRGPEPLKSSYGPSLKQSEESKGREESEKTIAKTTQGDSSDQAQGRDVEERNTGGEKMMGA